MADLYRSDLIDIDLNRPLPRSNAGELLATGDKLSNRYGVRVFRQGETVNLSGYAVTGYFIRPDMETVVITGAVSGNAAFVDLPQACYTQQGRFSLAVKISGGGITQTVRIVDGYIRTSQTGTLIDPGTAIPSLDDIFAQIAAMEQATANANTATQAAQQATAEAQEATQEMMTTSAPAIIPTATGSIVTITDGAARPAVELISHIEPVQEGSGDPSPDNVRPISGWDSVTAQRTGKNKSRIETFNGATWADSSAGLVDVLNSLPVGKYTISARWKLIYNGDGAMSATDQYGISISQVASKYLAWNTTAIGAVRECSITFDITESNTGKINTVYLYAAGNDNVGSTGKANIYDIQIERSEVATAYEPYQGQTLTADLPETVYGGEMNWTTGELENYGHKIVIDGTNIAVAKHESADGVYVIYNLDAYGHPLPASGGAMACSHFPVGEVGANNIHVSPNNYGTIYIGSVPGISDAAAYNAWLANNPITCIYRAAEPERIQLTPQQLSTLKGINNVWSSTGETTLSYVADTKMYIDQRISALLNA